MTDFQPILKTALTTVGAFPKESEGTFAAVALANQEIGQQLSDVVSRALKSKNPQDANARSVLSRLGKSHIDVTSAIENTPALGPELKAAVAIPPIGEPQRTDTGPKILAPKYDA